VYLPASLHHLLTTQEQVKLSTLLPDGTLRYIAVFSLIIFATACGRNEFTDREKTILATLSLSKLTPAAAVSNKFAFDERAQQFGEELFHETKLSAGNEFSCGSCHLPEKFFTDGLPTGVAVETTTRNTPALHGAAWQSWFYWDGRRDSMWSQALTPIESPQEMAGDRVAVTKTTAVSTKRCSAVFRLPGRKKYYLPVPPRWEIKSKKKTGLNWQITIRKKLTPFSQTSANPWPHTSTHWHR